MRRRWLIYLLLVSAILGCVGYFSYLGHKYEQAAVDAATKAATLNREIIPEKKTDIVVENNEVFNMVGAKAGLGNNSCYAIYNATKDVYDLANIKAGNKFSFYSNNDNQVNKIIYAVDNDRELTIEKSATSSDWTARLDDIVYEIRERTVEGEIDASSSSLYLSALAAGADEGALITFAGSLEYSIDFALDPRIGDKYKFIYEERYRDGKFANVGKVLAGAYLNGGKLIQSFYFDGGGEEVGFYDEKGNAVQKMFLKAPLSFKYISSPFTTGPRYIEKFNITTGHRAVDYAADYGTPIRAVGDGTVIFAGWNDGYGQETSIRHNSTYTTNYGHQSKILVKKGQKVKQGQVIGLVGSTGLSTGPHLHFEMVENGVKVNPASVIQPPGKPLSDAHKAEFMKLVESMKEKIKI